MGTTQAAVLAEVVATLRRSRARFSFLHGSTVTGPGAASSTRDLDVAAWWGRGAPQSWEVDLPPAVDLLVLDRAPLELAGRVAQHGRLLFDDDPPARVSWMARTRLEYLDEGDRQAALDVVFLSAHRHG